MGCSFKLVLGTHYITTRISIISTNSHPIPRPTRTTNRIRVANLSGCVPKILALQRWSKIDFPPEFQTRHMHSFPIMYYGVKSGRFGRQRPFSTHKNGLKTTILGATILDRLTSEGAGTQIFKGIDNFSMCFKKIGT